MRESPNFPAVHYSNRRSAVFGLPVPEQGRRACHRAGVMRIERFETALRYQPTDGDRGEPVRLRLALSLRRAGDPAAAIEQYRSEVLDVPRMDAGTART